MKHRQLLYVLPLALTLACGQPVNDAEEAVSVFRARRAAKNFDAIYAETTDGFKEVTSADRFNALMAGLEERLGPLRSSERENYTIFYGTRGSNVTLVYTSKFDKGDAKEIFIWRLGGGTPLLHEYAVHSDVLLLE